MFGIKKKLEELSKMYERISDNFSYIQRQIWDIGQKIDKILEYLDCEYVDERVIEVRKKRIEAKMKGAK